MIDNEFAYQLGIELDLTYLTDLILNKDVPKIGLAGHQRLVADDPYMLSIKEKFPFLSPYYNVYKNRPKTSIVLHTDAKRNCALNIPICNTTESSTIFYTLIGNPVFEYNARDILNEVKSPANEVFKFTLTTPTLINNTIPHAVEHWGTGVRTIISWSVEQTMLYSTAKDLFKQVGY
jgi:hypothetical protein